MATAESINYALEGALAPIEAQKKNLKATYEQQRKNLETDLQAQTDAIRRARDQALNEAYIVHRTQQRQLPQVLAAQGRTGGAVQSTVADITNEYQRSRRAAEGDYNLAHGDLQLQYNKNLGNLELDYGNDLNELDAQIAAARASAAAQLADLRARELEAQRQSTPRPQQNTSSSIVVDELIRRGYNDAAIKNYFNTGTLPSSQVAVNRPTNKPSIKIPLAY